MIQVTFFSEKSLKNVIYADTSQHTKMTQTSHITSHTNIAHHITYKYCTSHHIQTSHITSHTNITHHTSQHTHCLHIVHHKHHITIHKIYTNIAHHTSLTGLWHITTPKRYTNIAHHITYKHHTSHITTHTMFTHCTSQTSHHNTQNLHKHRTSSISHIQVWVIWCYLYAYIKQLGQFSAKWFGSNWNR